MPHSTHMRIPSTWAMKSGACGPLVATLASLCARLDDLKGLYATTGLYSRADKPLIGEERRWQARRELPTALPAGGTAVEMPTRGRV